MSGNGRRIVMAIATIRRRQTEPQPKLPTAACAWIVAVVGYIEAGSSAQLLVKGTPLISVMSSWGFAWQGRCHDARVYVQIFDRMKGTRMKIPILTFCLCSFVAVAVSASGERPNNAPHVVDLKSIDGTILKTSYFAAARPGPGVLLFHQSNRTRKSWEDIARQLVAVGINVLTVDTDPNKTRKQRWPGDLDAAFEFLVSQPGVKRDVIGIGGAGVIGVENSVETARRHSAEMKSLVLLSGETVREGLDFLRQASQLPELFVVADEDEYAPIVEAMELLYVTASSPSRKFVH